MFFRNLSAQEVQSFRQWARENYQPFSEIKGIWHPVVQEECLIINKEQSVFVDEHGNTVWCEQSGETPAEHFDDYAALCDECNKNLQAELEDPDSGYNRQIRWSNTGR